MKKVLIGMMIMVGFGLTSCEKDEVGEPNVVYVTPANCNCGRVISSNGLVWSGSGGTFTSAPYTTRVQTDCGVWEGQTAERYTGDICEWNIEMFNGGSANF